MKIIYLLDDTLDKSDGVQQCVVAIGEYMRSVGHEVHYFVAQTHRQDLRNVHSLVRFVSLRFNGNSVRTPLPASKKRIKELLEQIQPDIVHVQMPFSPLFSSKVIRLLPDNVRVVGTWHTFPTGLMQRLSHTLLSLLIKGPLSRVSTTIGVSAPTAEFADSIYGTHSIVVPNAVDVARFRVKPSLKYDIVYLGRFDSRKGPMHLLKALAELHRMSTYPRTLSVVMGGSGPDLVKCKAFAERHSLHIEFPGFIPEDQKPKLLSSARITVFPSTGGEAFGISVVEAMASGNSIVLGGDNPGYRSILGSKPELLLDPLDTKGFANKIIHYLALDESELKTKKSWLEDTASQYDTKTVCNQLLAVYAS